MISIANLSKEIGYTAGTIRSAIKRLGIKPHKPKKTLLLDDEQAKQIAELIAGDKELKEEEKNHRIMESLNEAWRQKERAKDLARAQIREAEGSLHRLVDSLQWDSYVEDGLSIENAMLLNLLIKELSEEVVSLKKLLREEQMGADLLKQDLKNQQSLINQLASDQTRLSKALLQYVEKNK